MTRVRLDAFLSTPDGQPIPSRTVYFYYRQSGTTDWLELGTAVTNDNGVATIIKDLQAGTYDFRAYFPGDDVYSPSEDVVTGFVVPGVTATVEEMGFPWWLALGLLLLLLLLAARRRREQY